MGSKDYPVKVVMSWGLTPLEHINERLLHSTEIKTLCLVTSKKAENDPLANHAVGLGWKAFRGSEDDVLKRYSECLVSLGAKVQGLGVTDNS